MIFMLQLEQEIGLIETFADAIAVCEGEQGWLDYRLLYHYDKSQKTDTLP